MSWSGWTCKFWIASLLGAHAVLAAPPRAIFHTLTGEPNSTAPGFATWRFRSGGPDQAFPTFALSPDGQRWVLYAGVESGSVHTIAVITGSGSTAMGARTVAIGGQSSFVPGRVYDALDLGVGVNNAGQVAFSGNLSGTTIDDHFAARDSGGVITLFAREGQSVPWVGAGVSLGLRLDGAWVRSDGSLALRVFLSGGGGGEALLSLTAPGTGTVLARSAQTIPLGQSVGTPQSISTFLPDKYAFASSGAGSIYAARLNGPAASDLVCVREGQVWAQESVTVPGSGFASPVRTIAPQSRGVAISTNGAHAACIGENLDSEDWVMLDGAVVARTGDTIAPGESLLFDDTRTTFAFAGAWPTNDGRIVLAAYTDGPTLDDSVLVLLGDRVLLREGDGVDTDSDGITDAVVGDFAPGGVVMTDDQRVYASCSIRSDTGSNLGSAWITFDARTCNDIDFNNDGLFPDTLDVDDFLSVFAGGACPTGACDDIDFNRDGLFPDTLDVDVFLSVFSGGGC